MDNEQEILNNLDVNTHAIKRVIGEMAREKEKYDENTDRHIKSLLMATINLIDILELVHKHKKEV
jgi:hypothetical protein